MGVVALQGVEVGEDLAIDRRFDGDESTDDPGTWLRYRVGKSPAVQRESLCGCGEFPLRAVSE